MIRKQWEYLILGTSDFSFQLRQNNHSIGSYLNLLGHQGWEIISCQLDHECYLHVVLKRERIDE